MAKARVDLPDPDLPQNASTPPGPAVAPAWSTCPQPRACKITGCNIRENAWTTVSRDAFASGHTRTRCSPTEKTNTPTPGQAIQCKFSHENARPHTLPQSSIHLLTSRPVEGGGVSPPINRSVNGPASAGTPSRPPYPWPLGLSVSPGSALMMLSFPPPPCSTAPMFPTLFSSGFSHRRRFCTTAGPLSSASMACHSSLIRYHTHYHIQHAPTTQAGETDKSPKQLNPD